MKFLTLLLIISALLAPSVPAKQDAAKKPAAKNAAAQRRKKQRSQQQGSKKKDTQKKNAPAGSKKNRERICKYCKGTKKAKVRCNTCKGSGVCMNSFCNKGQVSYDDVGRDNISKMCENCRGKNACADCNGTGAQTESCLLCDVGSASQAQNTACDRCSNTMTVQIPCATCRETGNCVNMMCKGGRITYKSLRGDQISKRCQGCNGRSVCLTCSGTGKDLIVCPSCRSTHIGGNPLKEQQFMAAKLAERDAASPRMSAKARAKRSAGANAKGKTGKKAANVKAANKKQPEDKKAANKKQPEDKKAANKKAGNKKAGNKKPGNKRPANRKAANKKPANKKPANKKVDNEKADNKKVDNEKVDNEKVDNEKE